MTRRASRSSIRSGRAGPNGARARRDDHRPHSHRSPPWGPATSWRGPDRSTSVHVHQGALVDSGVHGEHQVTDQAQPAERQAPRPQHDGPERAQDLDQEGPHSGRRGRCGGRGRASTRSCPGAGQGGQQGRPAQADGGSEEEPAGEGRQQELGRIAVSTRRLPRRPHLLTQRSRRPTWASRRRRLPRTSAPCRPP
jgi:hypothetical protein